MTIQLNGKAHSLDEQTSSVSDLLASLGLAGKPVVVELDKVALFPRQYAESQLVEGSCVEVISIAAGG
ncbi:sulfur carrier protein ThiS [Persicirhabdus sediminis]|uniref:Sulfur carrier protein ThiS n=1 Tax=Persicirhabdus sediminis TaxID=454144 RepID=A0A8J7SJP8_9BACT|nr:sulfur carrier protein ThiS [Persicirhabdus sediminis]MBK1792300.1 sulfur carrier protein ThiS [Persicirhabdus sediminis]